VAKRVRNTAEPSTRNIVMQTVVCQKCGQRFAITHDAVLHDADLAGRQAIWLQDQFVWDHIQESKHQGSILLPSLGELK
jgi:transcription elongation factor Elf1